MKLIDMQMQDYLRLVASDAPAPGGGSASALCGSQGIGLVAMVAKLTAGKEKFAAYRPVCDAVSSEADIICGKLAAQVDADTEAYGQIAAAFKLPKGTDEEKALRKKAVNDATVYAAEVPLETMRLGVQGLECAAKLMDNYNTNCASDVGCGVLGLLSCVMGARLNVLINVSGIHDAASAAKLRDESDALGSYAEAPVNKLYRQISAFICE